MRQSKVEVHILSIFGFVHIYTSHVKYSVKIFSKFVVCFSLKVRHAKSEYFVSLWFAYVLQVKCGSPGIVSESSMSFLKPPAMSPQPPVGTSSATGNVHNTIN